jgi:hypothetical protein
MSLVSFMADVFCSTFERAYDVPRSTVSAGASGTTTKIGTENSLTVVLDGAAIVYE